jgi:hypothetical protein
MASGKYNRKQLDHLCQALIDELTFVSLILLTGSAHGVKAPATA